MGTSSRSLGSTWAGRARAAAVSVTSAVSQGQRQQAQARRIRRSGPEGSSYVVAVLFAFQVCRSRAQHEHCVDSGGMMWTPGTGYCVSTARSAVLNWS